jgi:hypothetical protein
LAKGKKLCSQHLVEFSFHKNLTKSALMFFEGEDMMLGFILESFNLGCDPEVLRSL